MEYPFQKKSKEGIAMPKADTERLFKFLNDLGRDVEIVVKPKPRSRYRAKISAVAA
jgi:hypothetical protein